jgi:uncharacterized membrane protein
MRWVDQPERTATKRFTEMATWHEWPIDEFAYEGGRGRQVNVGGPERVASAIAGGALAAFGLTRKSAPGWILAGIGAYGLFRGISGHCLAYQVLGIDGTQAGRAQPRDFFERGIHVSKAVTINKPARELFDYWRDLTNLPRIMSHLKSVEVIDDCRSRWVAKGPMGSSIEWVAEIINEEPHELIAWRSLADAEVDNAGSVRFVPAPGGRGTEVRVELEYIPAAGKLGAAIAKLLGKEPGQQIADDLRRFKQLIETGEVPTTEGQPRGRCTAGA